MSRIRFKAANYALLLIMLLAIAAIAVVTVLAYLDSQISDPQLYRTIAATLWVLTMGFMLIVGAFGIRAVQFGVLAETRRQIGYFISALDAISDGVLWLDDRGHVLAMNPAARTLTATTGTPGAPPSLRSLFPGLAADDCALLLSPPAGQPLEIECPLTLGAEARILRWRAHTVTDGVLLFVNDISDLEWRRQHVRQSARMQLIGEITRGVARDFSNLMCSLSGDAYLLTHSTPGDATARQSATRIAREAERGNSLASRLLDLGQAAESGAFTSLLKDHIGIAVERLRESLPSDWSVRVAVPDAEFPALPVSGSQFELIIVHLGHLIVAAGQRAGCVHIALSHPTATPGSCGTLTIADDAIVGMPPEALTAPRREGGAVQAIIHSLLRDAGGDLVHLVALDGRAWFKIVLPPPVPRPTPPHAHGHTTLPASLSGRPLLLAGHSLGLLGIETALRKSGLDPVITRDFVGLLSEVQSRHAPGIVMLDDSLIRPDPSGLIKVLLQTRPDCGVVVVTEDPARELQALAAQIAIAIAPVAPNQVNDILAQAAGQARLRQNARTDGAT